MFRRDQSQLCEDAFQFVPRRPVPETHTIRFGTIITSFDVGRCSVSTPLATNIVPGHNSGVVTDDNKPFYDPFSQNPNTATTPNYIHNSILVTKPTLSTGIRWGKGESGGGGSAAAAAGGGGGGAGGEALQCTGRRPPSPMRPPP